MIARISLVVVLGVLAAAGAALLGSASPALPLFAVAGLAACVLAYQRPLASLYLALVLIPLELLSLDFGGFGITPTEGLFIITAVVWSVRRLTHREPLIAPSPALAPLAVIVCSVVPGLLVAQDPTAVAKQLVMWTVFLVCFLMVTVEGDRSTVRNVFLSLSLAAAVCSIVAIYDSRSMAPTLVDFGAVAEGRATGTFAHPSQLGLFLSIVVPMQAALMLRGPRALRPAVGVALVLSLVAVALSLSRGAFLALSASLLILLLWRPFRRIAGVAAVVFVILTLAGLNPASTAIDVGALGERITSTGAATQTDPRIDLWKQTPAIIQDHPVFGVGADNFQLAATNYGLIEPRTGGAQGHAHNLPLNVMAELGILGLAGLLWLVVVLTAVSLQTVRRIDGERRAQAIAVAASLFCVGLYGMTDYPLSSNMLAGTVFVLVGCSMLIARPLEARAPVPRASGQVHRAPPGLTPVS